MPSETIADSTIWKQPMRDGFTKILIGCLTATALWFALLVATCYLRQGNPAPAWIAWLLPRSTVLVWNTLLLAPAGLALGNIAGFFLSSYGKEQTRLSTVASQLPALFGVAVGVDALRGSDSYVVRLFERLGVACDTPAALAAVILLIFFPIGFLFMYMLKAAFINPLVEQASPELIRDAELKQRVEAEGVGRIPDPQTEGSRKSKGTARSVEWNADGHFGAEALQTGIGSDPQKGRWGGSSCNQGYILMSMVQPLPDNPELFDVHLQVQSIDPERPLTSLVQFHLHPTFANSNPKIVPSNGLARLSRLAWGAFTVGAEVLLPASERGSRTSDGSRWIPLELDLAEVPGFPERFVSR